MARQAAMVALSRTPNDFLQDPASKQGTGPFNLLHAMMAFSQ
jgi:hypothetical protein